MPNQRPNPRPYRMEYTKKINRLKMENDKPKKQVKVLKKELPELREKLKKIVDQRVVGTVKWFNENKIWIHQLQQHPRG